MKSTDRFRLVRISVQIKSDGAGMSNSDIEAMCAKLAKAAVGRSKIRQASAVCGNVSRVHQGHLWEQ